MSDFKARIIAELDTTQVEQKINELDGKKVKFGVDGGNAQKEVEKVDNSIKSATKSTKTFGDTLKTSAKLGAAYSITSQFFQSIREAASKAKEAVKEFDAAIMDLRMATGGTYSEVSNLVREHNELGKAIGATTKEISSGADSWLRQGHSIADANILIKDSMILSKVAELESAEATQYLTSAMKGYKVEVEDVISIVDKLTAVDLVSATEAGGLAEAMSRTAASANIAGVSMDKLLGYIAATGEVTQKSMTSIGESYKTIFTRMGDIKSGKLQFIDEDGTAESLSDVETVLNNLGIKLRDSNNEFRNFGDVLDEVGTAWNDYSTVQKAAISKVFAGTRQSENFKVLMENYGKATEYMEVSMNSAGTAEQKFEAYLDSLEAKTKSLQASFESLAINTFSTEMFGGVLDASTAVIKFLDTTNLLKGSLAGLATAGALKGFTVLASGISNASVKLNDFNAALNLVKIGNLGELEIQQLARMTSNLSDSQLKAVISSKSLTTQQRIAILTTQGMSAAEAKAALSSMGLATAEGAATTTTVTLSGALKGLWATLMSNPLILVVAAVTAAVSAYSSYKQKVEEAQQATLDAGNAAKDETTRIRELYSAYQEANNAYENNTGSKENLESATDALLKSLGLEESELEKLKEKYNDLDKAINNVTVSGLKSTLTDLTTGYQSALDKLLETTDESYFSGMFGHISSGRKEKLGTAFTDVLEDAGLISKGSNGDAGGYAIVFGNQGKADTLNDVIAIYEDITAMQKALEQGVSDGKYTREELANSNIWKQLSNKLNSFSEEYTDVYEYIDSINQTSAQIQILEWAQNNAIPESANEYKQLRNEMIAIAQSSGEFIGTQEQIEKSVVNALSSVSEKYIEFEANITDTKNVIEDTEKSINSLVNTMSKLTSLSSGFDLLDEIYADIYDKGDFDYSKIFNNEDFSEAFGEMPSYDSFMETIASSPDNLAACQNAFDQLTQEYIEHSHVLDNLTDAERDAAVAYLEQMGFANAAAIVDNKIAVAKEKKRIQTKLGAEATLDEILMMIDEEEQSYDTMRALVELAIAKLDVNRNAINLSSDINQIIDLAEKAGATTESLKNLAKAKALVMEAERYEDLMKTTADPRGKATLAHWADDLYAQAEAIKNEPIEYKLAEYKYSGGSKYNSAVDKAVKDAEKEAEKNEPQKYDWIEKSISRIERVINKLKNTANSTYKSLKTRLGATANQITEVNKLLKIQQQAYNRYMEEANAVGLSPELAEKVRNGTIDITEYDEDTKELIEDYAQWYEKALECSDAIDELHESLASLYEDNFDNIKSNFENQLELAEYLTNSYENGIDMLEAKGYLESTKYYAAMQTAQKQNIATLTAELVGLEAAFAQAMASGEIEAYSESWYNMRNAINGVKSEIQAANVELAQYDKKMREIEWSHFDYTQDRIAQLTQEADFLIDLMSYSDLLNDKGKLTDKGMATAGLHGQNYNVYMAQADMYANEIASLDREMARDPFNADLIARREELLGLQQEAIIAAEEEKQAIVDLVEEGINLELESLKELIDTYTESLDSAKDLYEYQKKVKEQTETIASIQKQLSAYENDTSEETKAKVQQLKVDLSEAQEDLAETEYERYISDTKKLLDELYLDFETTLNQRLDNVDALISEMIDSVNFNSDSINSTLISVTNSVGYTMTDQMSSIWENAENVISQYGDEISTSIDSVISAIQANTAAMVAASNAEAIKTVVSTAASTVTTPSTTGSILTAVGSAINSMTNTGSDDSQKKDTSTKTISKGSKINAKGAPIYDYVGDTSEETQVFGNDPYYTVLDEQDGYLKVRWHKLSSGVTGWFKKSDVKAYKTGGLVDYTGLAQLDGTPQKPEIVLNPEDSQNFLALRDTLREMAKTDLGINSYNVAAPQLTGLTDITGKVAELRSNAYTVNVGDINYSNNINIDHVENYDDFVTKLRDDKKFEQMISSMTIEKLVGKSPLNKYNYKWN